MNLLTTNADLYACHGSQIYRFDKESNAWEKLPECPIEVEVPREAEPETAKKKATSEKLPIEDVFELLSIYVHKFKPMSSFEHDFMETAQRALDMGWSISEKQRGVILRGLEAQGLLPAQQTHNQTQPDYDVPF